MLSVITTTYNTPPHILARTWASLKHQTHTDWEWVIYDDSTTDSVQHQVYGFCSDERFTIRYFRPHTPSGGNIGYAKRMGFALALGEVLVELDHDDELTPDALTLIAEQFTNPTVGFVYSDWCEILPDGNSGKYPDGWAFGYGDHYWDTEHNVWAMKAPPINHVTLSHIVSAPNHVRAWRTSVYHHIGGHDTTLPVADDYDLVVRTLAVTGWVHIPKMIYKQHIGGHTAQRQRNGLIQDLVAQIRGKHPECIFGLESPSTQEV